MTPTHKLHFLLHCIITFIQNTIDNLLKDNAKIRMAYQNEEPALELINGMFDIFNDLSQ